LNCLRLRGKLLFDSFATTLTALYGNTNGAMSILSRRGLSSLRWATLAVLPLLIAACNADHIVSVDAGLGSHLVAARVGDLIDVRLWGGALGNYTSPPDISTAAVEFVDISIETSSGRTVNPGGPTQRFRFRAVSRGSAIVTFAPMQSAPVVVDTVVVQ
jgi:hypothetical protein